MYTIKTNGISTSTLLVLSAPKKKPSTQKGSAAQQQFQISTALKIGTGSC